jgi:hypothetical protein
VLRADCGCLEWRSAGCPGELPRAMATRASSELSRELGDGWPWWAKVRGLCRFPSAHSCETRLRRSPEPRHGRSNCAFFDLAARHSWIRGSRGQPADCSLTTSPVVVERAFCCVPTACVCRSDQRVDPVNCPASPAEILLPHERARLSRTRGAECRCWQ